MSSATIQRAKRSTRSVDALADVASRVYRPQVIAIDAAIANAWRAGDDPIESLRQGIGDIAMLVAGAGLAATLRAYIDAVADVRGQSRIPDRRFSVYDDAVDAAQRLLGVDDATLGRLRSRYAEVALRLGGDLLSAVEPKLRDAMRQSTLAGEHTAAGIRRLRETLRKAGVTGVMPHRLETIFRSATQLAYSAGSSNADRSTAISEILWGYEYSTVGDDRVRPSHAALDGVRLPKDHPLWLRIKPPNDWNCRCTVVRIFTSDSDRSVVPPPDVLEIDGVVVRPVQDIEWQFDPGALLRDITLN